MKKSTIFSLVGLCVLVAGTVAALVVYINKNGCCFCDNDDDDDFDFDYDDDNDYCCSGEFCAEDCDEYTKKEVVEIPDETPAVEEK